jgi:hypothetical protein
MKRLCQDRSVVVENGFVDKTGKTFTNPACQSLVEHIKLLKMRDETSRQEVGIAPVVESKCYKAQIKWAGRSSPRHAYRFLLARHGLR